MNCETSCGPAPVPTNMFPLTTVGSSFSAALPP